MYVAYNMFMYASKKCSWGLSDTTLRICPRHDIRVYGFLWLYMCMEGELLHVPSFWDCALCLCVLCIYRW